MKLSVSQINELNSYLKTNPQMTEEAAVQLIFGQDINTQFGKGISVETSGDKPHEIKQTENEYVAVSFDGKTYNLNKSIEKRIDKVTEDLKQAEDSNGFIGKSWSWIKNTVGFGDSSDKVREQQETEQKLLAQFNSNPQRREEVFKQLTGADYTPENLEKFIKGEIKLPSEISLAGYKEGQETAVDVVADVVSGVASFGVAAACVAGGIAAAPFTAGASLGAVAVGLSVAAGSGAVLKTGIKFAEAKSGDGEYTLKDAGHDAATGAFSGALAPLTAGVGGAVGRTAMVQLGKAGLKTGVAKAVAFTAEVTADGALGGGVDNAFRTAINGGSAGEVLDAAITGAEYGAVLGPVMGWGGKGVSNGVESAIKKINPTVDNGLSYNSIAGHKYNLHLTKGKYEKLVINPESAKKLPNPHPKNLTNELQRIEYGLTGVRSLLENNPQLSRTVGSLPPKWGAKIGATGGFSKIDDVFSAFAKECYSGNINASSVKNLEQTISELLGSSAKVEYIGQGNIGFAYKISVDNQSFVLKTYNSKSPFINSDWHKGYHGNYPELCGAVYASKHAKGQFAPFYMGKFGENNDGYILTKFIEPKPAIGLNKQVNGMGVRHYKNFVFSKDLKRMTCSDLKDDNVFGKTIIDYGGAGTTLADKMSAKGLKLAQQVAEALDNNSADELRIILDKHGTSKEMKEVKDYLRQLINENCTNSKYAILEGKKDLLKMLDLEYKPDIKYILSHPIKRDDLVNYNEIYGISYKDFKKLKAEFDN